MKKPTPKDAPKPNVAPKAMTYVVTQAGFVAGQRRAKGEEVQLNAAQAKYEHVELKPGQEGSGPVEQDKPKADRGAAKK
ncbi:hypothetical protein [Pseudaestuariivita sp.]|uniref:hypothetical protein n=1 Tax=Pseudaestuariivita sp. TaxID=2211669 RepID=UPI00405A3FDD